MINIESLLMIGEIANSIMNCLEVVKLINIRLEKSERNIQHS